MSDVDTLTLAEFLLARIAEDEAAARAHPYGHKWEWEYLEGWGVFDPENAVVAEGTWNSGGHIARFDPARVLAECEAKRKIIALHRRNRYQPTQCVTCGWAERWEVRENGPTYPCDVLKTLAAIYADHPDYREDWDEHEPEEEPGDHLPPRQSAH